MLSVGVLMVETLIRGALSNFSLVMLALSLVVAALRSGSDGETYCSSLLRWLLLLAVGVTGIYTFVMHVFFPATSAENIGWAVSPFQYEVGMADLTVGVLGVLAFWGDFGFRLAAVVATTIWLWGDAVGHVRQMIVAHNFARERWAVVLDGRLGAARPIDLHFSRMATRANELRRRQLTVPRRLNRG